MFISASFFKNHLTRAVGYGIILIVVNIGMSPSGKAPDFDSGIRRFKSGHPSQHKRHSQGCLLCWLGWSHILPEHLYQQMRRCTFAVRRSTSSLVRRRTSESRSEAELPAKMLRVFKLTLIFNQNMI